MIWTIAGGIMLAGFLQVVAIVALCSLVLAWEYRATIVRVVLVVVLAAVVLTHLAASLVVVGVLAVIAGALALALGVVKLPKLPKLPKRPHWRETHAERLAREIAAAETAGRA